MGEIVNLRRVKKQRARDQAAREAESARARRAVDQARIEE